MMMYQAIRNYRNIFAISNLSVPIQIEVTIKEHHGHLNEVTQET